MRVPFFFFTVVFVALCCSGAFAADWSFTPSATLSELYNSNITFSSPARGDLVSSLDTVLSITGQTESTIFQFNTDTTGEKYLKYSQYDTVDTNTSMSLTELWSPRFSTDANFTFYHDYTLENSLQTSGIITPLEERYQYNAGGGVKYALTENLSLQASGSYIYTLYPSHQAGLPDEQAYQVTVTPLWSITPLDVVGLSSNLARQDYPSFSTETNTVTEMLYWKRLLSEQTSLELSAGYYFTWSSFVIQALRFIPPYYIVLVNMPGSGSGGGPAATVSLKKDWSDRFSTTLMANKSQYSDTYAQNFDQTTFGFTASYRLSDLTTVNFSAAYDMNDQISQGNEEIDYVSIGPSIERKINENLTVRLRGSYEFETTSNNGTPAVNYDQYCVWVELAYQWPRFWATH